MKWLVYEEIQTFHPDIYVDDKILDLYDACYAKTKASNKVHHKLQVTESDMRSFRDSRSQSYRSTYSAASQFTLSNMAHQPFESPLKNGSVVFGGVGGSFGNGGASAFMTGSIVAESSNKDDESIRTPL